MIRLNLFNRCKNAVLGAALLMLAGCGGGGSPAGGVSTHVYRATPQGDLQLWVHPVADADGPRPAVVFFHGGGFKAGKPDQFRDVCDALAAAGVVGVRAAYRLGETAGVSPRDAMDDGVAAFGWVHEHAEQLGIDPTRIGAGGSSAGGQMALYTAFAPGPGPRPAAVMARKPVVNLGPGGYEPERFAAFYSAVSPLHAELPATWPPTLIQTGAQDTLAKVEDARAFVQRLTDLGASATLIEDADRGHELYSWTPPADGEDPKLYYTARQRTVDFLTGLGWTRGQ